jgi:cytochrome P450
MRVHPGVRSPLWRITPKGGATICGHFIPEGTEVGMIAWVVHQDKRVFGQDANVFRPERWLDSDTPKIAAMDRAFFSVGPSVFCCRGDVSDLY